MKKLFLIMALCFVYIASNAQTNENNGTVKLYCEVMCVQYNLFKQDVNALVDFGIAEQGKYANGWIYDSSRNKKYSFASPMSVFAYMANRGWEYKDAFIVTETSSGLFGGKSNVYHFILSKDFPLNYSQSDVIGDIDYRNK